MHANFVLICNSKGAPTFVTYDGWQAEDSVLHRVDTLLNTHGQVPLATFIQQLRSEGSAFAPRLNVTLPGYSDCLALLGKAVPDGYCVVGKQPGSTTDLLAALQEVISRDRELPNSPRWATPTETPSCQQGTNDMGSSQQVGSGQPDVDELTRLNNKLMAAQRVLSEKNRHLTNRLAGLERDRAALHLQHIEVHDAHDKLQKSHAALSRFALTVSHDLRAPARLIGTFVGKLQRKCGPLLDAEGQLWLDYIVTNASHMQQLVEDLLEYSRVGTHERAFGPVQLQTMVDDLHALFREDLKDCDFSCGTLPTVHGDLAQLKRLFQNLIQNAIAYRSAKKLVIQVGAETSEHYDRLWVRDNGIGIAPKDQDAIFEMFRRLHPASHFTGTGAGLAICKQIVEHHGGRLEVESAEGRGSTFWVTLPRKPSGGHSRD